MIFTEHRPVRAPYLSEKEKEALRCGKIVDVYDSMKIGDVFTLAVSDETFDCMCRWTGKMSSLRRMSEAEASYLPEGLYDPER